MSDKFKPDFGRVKENISKISAAAARLRDVRARDNSQRMEISKAVESFRAARVKQTLAEIDVEELNSGRQGIKTSLLRSAGYKSIADIVRANVMTLERISGIGRQSAEKIKSIADEVAKNAAKNTSVKLAADDKSAENLSLIKLLFKYKRLKPSFDSANELLESSFAEISTALDDAQPAQGRLKWMFTGAEAKEKARFACDYLESVMQSGFVSTADELHRQVTRIAPDLGGEALRDFEKNSAEYFTLLEELGVVKAGESEAVAGLSEALRDEIESVALDLTGLKATLRIYQKFGVKYIINQGNVLLGDEMGLGKTVQAIASLVVLRNAGEHHFVVVCPASVLINWCREVEKFCDIECTKVHGKDAQSSLEHWKENGGIAVTTYETLDKFELSDLFKFGMLIVDEAHYVKNPNAKRTKNLLEICDNAKRILFMTGTALENRVEEMCFLIGCLCPDIASELKNIQALSGAPQFRRIIAPVYFRRTRDDVLTELPDLIQKEQWCTVSSEEYKAYKRSAESENYMQMRQVSFLGVAPESSSKLQRLLQICEEAKDDNRKVLIFSFFINTINTVKQALGELCLEPITGEIQPKRRQEIIDEFDKAPSGAVLLAQIQAGGTGLNIQSASVVIICEPQIKPSIEHQAISRAYRMGQVRSVIVHRLLADETIDERILELLRAKQLLFDSFADVSVSGQESLSLDESSLNDVFAREVEKLKSEDIKEG
ncbi:MAG: DEAD/DEAH box helicase [Ruminococcus sp.]|nr:DEAD/DEAH box helicase [Ruminococcus sp.]